MKIKRLQLNNFRRFTDLTLDGIPEFVDLVLLIGSNGSGKSSVFDALQVLNFRRYQTTFTNPNTYYSKNNLKYRILADFGDGYIHDTDKTVYKSTEEVKVAIVSYYGRTSFRQIPRLTRTQLGTKNFDIAMDGDRPTLFIDRDERFENDLEHIFGQLLKEFFKTEDEKFEIKNNVIQPINNALDRIFSKDNGTKLELIELIPPLEGKYAEINFKKGESKFHYNQLSAGEKEIFNILINLIARKDYYKNGILFFDELDLHLNTKLQYYFLKEITENWIPPNCQFWTASHSLGFIQYAKESERAAIFDLDDLDFDKKITLTPESKDRSEVYEIAVSKEILPHLFKDRKIVFVENEDRKYYASLNIDTILFVPEKNRDSVFFKAKSGQFNGLIDRDFLTDNDIAIIEDEYPNLKVLRLYCVENYLFHPENLEEFFANEKREFDKSQYIQRITEEKDRKYKELLIKVATIRQGYPFFKETGMEKSPYKKRFTPDADNFQQTTLITEYLESNDIDIYLKSFSLKDYCKSLPERQNLNPYELSKTTWFKNRIEEVLKKQYK